MTKGELAKEYFESGSNCSQAVALAFCEEMKLDEKTVSRQTIGFGGGMGRMREVCGTVSGMIYVLSNLYGESNKAAVYSMVQTVSKKFQKENGSIICRELLGLDKNGMPSPVPEPRTESYYKKRPCAELCRMAADILDDFIKEYNSKQNQ